MGNSTSDIIHLLPDSVANQIAAGEVVQRPASIVKEMVENSIDAGATNIQVLVTDGGKTCVQVIDNGKGMSETDARLSFERHATSKIQSASDLYRLTTMGFRGEALASIAAVAQIELKTRRPEDELGTCIRISGSKIESQEPVSCPIGCNFSVKNLFFNVPARRKFMKSNQTELSNIVADFEKIVLVYPDISFSLFNNGAEIYHLPSASLRQRILDVYGKKVNAELLPLEAETSLVSISGYVGKPETARKKGAHQFFFVNGRFMRHPYFHSAVMHAFDNLLPAGEHVSYFIYFSVDASSIDVNVHPTKTEIKFDNEQAIWQVLSAVVRESIGKYNDVPTIDFDVADKPNIPAFKSNHGPVEQPRMTPVTYNPFAHSSDKKASIPDDWEKLYQGIETFKKNSAQKEKGKQSLVSNQEEFIVEGLLGRGNSMNTSNRLWNGNEDVVNNQDLFADIASLPHFQYKGRFIVVPFSTGLLLVDQHRAHTRVLFEVYMQQMSSKKHVSQGNLFPELIQFTKNEELTLQNVQEELSCLGFELTNLGGGSYSINGVPTDIDGLEPAKLLHSLIYAAMDRGVSIKAEVEQSISLAMAQSAAIVYGQVLTDEEISNLLTQLFSLPTPMRTPDGKLVFSIIEHSYIEKLF